MCTFVFVGLALQCATVHAWGFCNDYDLSCAMWANDKECEGSNAAVVKGQCPHSCSVCTHICRDVEAGCPNWAANGKQCMENPDYMNKNCPISCGICKPKCYDKDELCGVWARSGECTKNPSIAATCPVSCGICSSLCMDQQNDCPQWAAGGDCNTNPGVAPRHFSARSTLSAPFPAPPHPPDSPCTLNKGHSPHPPHPPHYQHPPQPRAGFMLKQCPFSCDICNEKEHGDKFCSDRDHNQCLIWGEHECSNNPGAVMRSCPKLCGLCTLVCEDKHADCPAWAEAKDGKGCQEDSDYMHEACPFSCGTCAKLPVLALADKAEL